MELAEDHIHSRTGLDTVEYRKILPYQEPHPGNSVHSLVIIQTVMYLLALLVLGHKGSSAHIFTNM